MGWVIVAGTATSVGFALAVVALTLSSGPRGKAPRGRLALLTALVAGCGLAVVGLYHLFHYVGAPRAEGRVQLKELLESPLESVTVRVFGPDPFRDRLSARALRLRVGPPATPEFVSRVPRTQMRGPVAGPEEGVADYHIAWKSVVRGGENENSRAAAAGFVRVADWREVNRARLVELEVIVGEKEQVPVPVSLQLIPNEHPSVDLFFGNKVSGGPQHQENTWVSTYRDHLILADRLVGWDYTLVPLGTFGRNLAYGLMAAVLLLACGTALLLPPQRFRLDEPNESRPTAGEAEAPPNLFTFLPSQPNPAAPKYLWKQPVFWLALQVVFLALVYSLHEEFQLFPEGTSDAQRAWLIENDGYLYNSLARELSWDSLVKSMTANRTFGVPLALYVVAGMSPSWEAWPFLELLMRVLGVFAFYGGLRSIGISAWPAAAGSSCLFYTNQSFWDHGFRQLITSDPLGESLTILTLGLLLLVVGFPGSRAAWSGLTVSLFLTYHTRPASLFLLGLVPVLGFMISGIASPRAEWCRRRARLVVGLCALSFLPYLGWCSLRLALVGHFGLVSFGGYSAVYITGLFLTEEVLPELPESVRPLAAAVLEDRARLPDWQSPLDERGRIRPELVHDEDRFYKVYVQSADVLYLPNAIKLDGNERNDASKGYDQDWVDINRALGAIAMALIKARPAAYVHWLGTAFWDGAKQILLINYLLKRLLVILVGLLGIWHGLYLLQRFRRGPRGAGMGLAPAPDSLWAFHTLALIAVSSALAALLLCILVLPMHSRYAATVGVFLPTVVTAALFLLGDQIRAQLAALRGRPVAATESRVGQSEEMPKA